ncbi:3D domain-containing protein [Alicyclobacillus dauci]|uniref:3D domain-containing protein n=1 Tax=Alicyclobacillus dauci TaxID=1475485 RepID=A0ABY6YZ39_9BACL|nr:3D domain-containing protein [Alicyclobacillus dauci]WAH35724.1 3D domain-containing protein [Alicyclobacillus dauci]
MDNRQKFQNRITRVCLVGVTLWSATWNVVTAKPLSDRNLDNTAIYAFGKSYDLSQYNTQKGAFLLTAYNLDKRSTGKSPGDPGFGITATGTLAETGRTVAVDPRIVPYGSLLYIDGIGWRVAEDTGGAIRGHHIDVLVDSRQKAMVFGVKRDCQVKVFIPNRTNWSVRAIRDQSQVSYR